VSIRQVTIVGTGLIGGSFGLALRKQGFTGRIVGCDRPAVLERACARGAIEVAAPQPSEAIRGSQLVLLAAPVLAIIDLVNRLGSTIPSGALLTDVGSTKAEIMARAGIVFVKEAAARFLGGHPMAGKEQSGVDFADPDLFQGAAWFLTPFPGQRIDDGVSAEYLYWLEQMGAHIARIHPDEHDQLCAWISHLPQMISTALAAALVEEYGPNAPLLEAGGRALREMTRTAASPYSVWRDIAITNKKQIQQVLLKLEQRLAHIRQNLDTRDLATEFEQARQLKRIPPRSRGDTEKNS